MRSHRHPAHPTPHSKANKGTFLQYQLGKEFDGEMEIPENCIYLFSTKQKDSRREGVTARSLDVGSERAPTCPNNGERGSRWKQGASPSSALRGAV